MNLLVTGAAGFIGSHFVLRHVEKHPEDKIIVLDKLTYAADKSLLDPVADAIEFIEGDIADRQIVTELVESNGINVIMNFAAESHVDNSIEDAAPFLQTNIIGTQNLIEVTRDHPEVWLFHISTDEVHGDIDDGDAPRTPSDPLFPSSPYAASKASAEMLMMAAMRTWNIRSTVTRCTNNYGPHQADEKFIPVVIRNALQDSPIPIYAEGKNKRDWLYVTDHTDAIETILATDWADQQHFFHISANAEWQNIDVAKLILTLLDKPESLLEFVTDRPGHDWRYALDSSNTRALGWQPTVSFEQGIKRTIEWYQNKYV